MRIFLHQKAILALSGELSEGDRGGSLSKFEAWRILCELVGLDLGLNPNSWKAWFMENVKNREDFESLYSRYDERVMSSLEKNKEQSEGILLKEEYQAIFDLHQQNAEDKTQTT